jgi:Kef-type K+ transport system membrane component KefB
MLELANAWAASRPAYIVLLFVLFIVPRLLQRFRVPTAITALAFGAAAGMGLGWFRGDNTVDLLSTLGVVALFVFAGLDVELRELRRERRPLVEHIVVSGVALAVVSWACVSLWHQPPRVSVLVALALLTPSTGFILDSINSWGLSDRERFRVRSKAIATELVALMVLLVTLQSTSVTRLTLSTGALVAMVVLLPVIFRWFASAIIPYAPKSEFGFVMLVAVICAVITRSLGVYYLVGAFVVGMAARQLRNQIPALTSERLLGSVESFASLFVPFYFFHAGLGLTPEHFQLASLLTGAVFLAVAIPLRLGIVIAHGMLRYREPAAANLRVAIPLMPTTVFTLVLATILRDSLHAPSYIFGGLVVYTLVNTMIPGFAMPKTTPSFDDELLLGDVAAFTDARNYGDAPPA